jgi:hypothetical protein
MPGTQTSSVRRSMARSVSSDWPAVKVFRLATAGRLIASSARSRKLPRGIRCLRAGNRDN